MESLTTSNAALPLFSPEQYRLVHSVLFRCGIQNEADRDDLAQIVFLRAIENFSSLRNKEAFLGWLAAIAKSLAYKFYKRRLRINLVTEEGLSIADTAELPPLEQIIAQENRERVLCALGVLKLKDQQVLRLFHLEGLSLEETQKRLSVEEGREVPLGTVKRRLYYARERLQGVLLSRKDAA